MKRIKEYTYNDWWEGKYCLATSTTVTKNPLDERKFKRIALDKFSSENIDKIKEKQINVFEEQVGKKFDSWKQHFTKKINNSQMKEVLLEYEIKQTEDIMFGSFSVDDSIATTTHWKVIFYTNDLAAIQNHIKTHKINGEALDYSFVHSPNFKYQTESYKVYAECLWKYAKWLRDFKLDSVSHQDAEFQGTKTELPDSSPDENNLSSKSEKPTPENPFPTIFRDGYCFQMFMALVNRTVNKRYPEASFSFIFHKLKTYGIIDDFFSHAKFGQFIYDHDFCSNLYTKFPKRDPASKELAFEDILKEFRPYITSISEKENSKPVPKRFKTDPKKIPN